MQKKSGIQKKLNIQKAVSGFIAAAALAFFMQLGITMEVYAADGNLSIAVSSGSVEVGDTVTVTLRASGPNGEGAAADMQFTYDSGVFSFVSCDTDNYSGGEGGQVNASGSTVNVTLKAVGAGSSKFTVTGSNGMLKDSQEALSGMTAAGATVSASGGAGDTAGSTNTGSGDNSLAKLSLSAGELSPSFVYSTTEYSASVPYDTTSVEVNATPSHGKAKVTAISGNDQLQVGENTITVTVEAENGAKAVYKIVVTREADGTAPDGTAPEETGTDPNAADGTGTGSSEANGTEVDQAGTEEIMSSAQEEEYQDKISLLEEKYSKLNEKYKSEKSFSRKIIAVMVFVAVVLLILCVNLFIFMKRRDEGDDEWEFLDDEDSDKKKTDVSKRADAAKKADVSKGADAAKKADVNKKAEDWPDHEEEDWMDDEEDWLDQEEEKEEKKDSEIEFIDLDDL